MSVTAEVFAQALADWQAANRPLTVDGKLGRKTWAKLEPHTRFSAAAAPLPAWLQAPPPTRPPLEPAPRSGGGPAWIQVAQAERQRWDAEIAGWGADRDRRRAETYLDWDEQYFAASPMWGGVIHDPGETPNINRNPHWCAAFVNYCLHRAGYSHTGSAGAGSFIQFNSWHFRALEEPQRGCVIVVGNGGAAAHVAFLDEDGVGLPRSPGGNVENARRVWLLGGNQSNRITRSNDGRDLLAARGRNGVTSPYLWPDIGPPNCNIELPTERAHSCSSVTPDRESGGGGSMRSALRGLRVAAVTAAAGLAAGGAAANDVAFGGAGADLVPLAEDRVQMLSEDILIERVAPGGYRILGDGYWRVRATYRFRNLTDETVPVQMGFPEPACPEDGDCTFAGFEDMATTVRGEAASLSVGAVDRRHPWTEHIDRVHVFAVAFTPGETVEVVHAYRHGLTEYVNGGEDLAYVTRTGALWAGTIDDARVRVRLPYRPWGISPGAWGPHLLRLTERLADGQPEVELEFRRTQWEPEDDLRVVFGPGYPTLETPGLIAGCPSHGELFDHALAVEAVDPADLLQRTQSLSATMLRLCRNAVFAHHGKDFDDAELDRFFYGERGLRVHGAGDDASAGRAVFARNPDFAPAMLTDPEWAYVKALQLVEQRR
jgi:uncharacterized protein (TIGR02594 family)